MKEERREVVKIVPPDPCEKSGITRTQGTKVVLSDGTELGNVTQIVLTADIFDAWTAHIKCKPEMGVMKGMVATIKEEESSWWRKLLVKLSGCQIEYTSIDSEGREFRNP